MGIGLGYRPGATSVPAGGGGGGGATPYTLTSITDIPSGAVDGDAGVYGDAFYRLTAPLALPNGGTRAFWVPAEIYGRSPVVEGYADGDEDTATVALQGLTVLQSNGGTVSSLGTEHQFLPGSTAGAAAAFTFTPASRNFYVRGDIRADFGVTGTWNGQILIAYGPRTFNVGQTQLTSAVVRSLSSTGAATGAQFKVEAFPATSASHRTYENLFANEAAYSEGELLVGNGINFSLALARIGGFNGGTAPLPTTDFRTKNVVFMSYT